VLVEINATDGDIGFHFLMDGDDLNSARIHDPDGVKVFQDMAKGPLREQKLTETFVESAEPLCWADPEADEDEEIVTLAEFLEAWTPGTYTFTGSADGGEKVMGETELTFDLPAAPIELDFDGSVISWAPGDDLGNCSMELADLIEDGVLPPPGEVEVAAWEVVFEPDVEDGDPLGQLKFIVRLAGDIATREVTVPAEYLADLPDNTLIKIEVGAIGTGDNATFTEIFDICVNEDEDGCEDDD